LQGFNDDMKFHADTQFYTSAFFIVMNLCARSPIATSPSSRRTDFPMHAPPTTSLPAPCGG